MENEKPIVEIRAVNRSWLDKDGNEKFFHRIEYRRQGETGWVPLPVIEMGLDEH